MSTLPSSTGNPLVFTLAADSRLGTVDYLDDQIWEVRLGSGEPRALAIETTYGLRAQRMRLFPRFLKQGIQIDDPFSFYRSPVVTQLHPNAISFSFAPFEGIEITANYWAADSHCIAGRFQFSNTSVLTQSFLFEWAALLNMRDQIGGMSTLQQGAAQFLVGEVANLRPVVFLTGGAQPTHGPYPALGMQIEMYPGNARSLEWAVVSLPTQIESMEAAQEQVKIPWKALTTRFQMQSLSDTIQIDSGRLEWDAAFDFAQRSALQLLRSPSQNNNEEPPFTLTRRVSDGYSERGDGRDHASSWRSQTVFDAVYLAQLLPGAPLAAQSWVRAFLSTQEVDGKISERPWLKTSHPTALAQPMLAYLATLAAPLHAPADWFREVYPALLHFFHAWLSSDSPMPTWQNALQSTIEDSPIFDRFSPDAHGAEPFRIHSPALLAMLHSECQSLLQMAVTLEYSADIDHLHILETRLAEALSETWDEATSLYDYSDSATHLSAPSSSVVSFQGDGVFPSKRRFKQSRRLVLRIETDEEHTHHASISISGFSPDGEINETISSHDFLWFGNQAHLTTENTFLAVENVTAQGLNPNDRVRIFTPDFSLEDCSLLLPLWAGAPQVDRARKLVQNTLLTRFWQPYGIPISPNRVEILSLPWNTLLGEGMLRYGYRIQAAALLEKIMKAVIPTLATRQAFFQSYDGANARPTGEQNHLHGLAPVRFFLHILGIAALDPREILLDGFSPFPDPITVKYRKTTLICCSDHTEVTFPAGQRLVIDRPGIHRIVLT